MEVTVLGIDLAKNVFQLHGVDRKGRPTLRKKIARSELAAFTSNLNSCLIAMEACGGSHYWAKKFRAQGHTVKLIAAQHVKPYRQSQQKNDRNDAEAIAEAVQRPKMKFVGVKTEAQQDLQSLHRMRQQLVDMRTATINQCRGLLMEYGVTMSVGATKFSRELPEVLEDATNELTATIREIARNLKETVDTFSIQIKETEKKILNFCKTEPNYKRLLKVPGVGPLIASMFLASVGDAREIKNGRHLSAWMGLVPRQCSSGGRERLLGITKAGDSRLRALMIHGARSVILSALRMQRQDPHSQWILKMLDKKGWNVTAVAIANRNCRIMCHLIKHEAEYKAA